MISVRSDFAPQINVYNACISMYIKFDFILENNTFEFTFLQTVV